MESIDKELSSSMEEAFIEAAKICEESDPANLFSSSFDDVLVAEAMAVEALAAEGLAIEGVAAKGVTDKGATKECLGEKGVIEEAFFDDDQEEMSSSVDKLLEDTAKVYDEIRSPNLLTEDELMLALESDPDNLRLEAGEGVDRSIESYMKVLVKAVMKDKQVVTYKMLSRNLQCHENLAKQMLYAFIQCHSELLKGITYYVSGVSKLANGSERKNVKLIKEKQLKQVLSQMLSICSIHVYSVQLNKEVDVNQIQNAQNLNFQQESLVIGHFSAILNERVGPVRPRHVDKTEIKISNEELKSINDATLKRSHQQSIKDFFSDLTYSKKQKRNCTRDTKEGQTSQLNEAPVNVKPGEVSRQNPNENRCIPSKLATNVECQNLLSDKYKPDNCKSIIGQQGDNSNMNKLKLWLLNWNRHRSHGETPDSKHVARINGAVAKAALLSGPPGVGKTVTAYLVSKELGYDVVELNASDTRSRKKLQKSLLDTLNTTIVTSIIGSNSTKKWILLMDELDGMLGTDDRGGITELIKVIKECKVPIVCICNDRNHQQIRNLSIHCFDLRFNKPRVQLIKASMMSICFKENIKIKPEALTELIVGCEQDVRQILNNLSMIRAGSVEGKMEAWQAKKEVELSKKTSVKMGPWDVCKKVFKKEEHKAMSFDEKSNLYFYNYNLGTSSMNKTG